jgi:hypothetical protein
VEKDASAYISPPANGDGSSTGRALEAMEAKLSDNLARKATADIAHEKLSPDELRTLLRDVTEQRDKLLSQFQAMARQTDDSARVVAEAQLEERYEARRAEECERHVEQEATQASELSRRLEEQERKSAAIAAEFARYRDAVAHGPIEDPWGVLGRAVLQIIGNSVAWLRAKIPADSALLPWFDRVLAVTRTTANLLLEWSKAFFTWAKPHAIRSWRRLRSEVASRIDKRKSGP